MDKVYYGSKTQEDWFNGSYSNQDSVSLNSQNKVRLEGRWSKEYHQYESIKKTSWSSSNTKQKTHEVEKGSFLHLFAGGVAGCASTLVTCPIDVIKTRQQSSGQIPTTSINRVGNVHVAKTGNVVSALLRNNLRPHSTVVLGSAYTVPTSVLQHSRYILHVEGLRSFYKGLGPSLVGVVPSRALFFYSYETAKKNLQAFGFKTGSVNTHVLASAIGGFVCTSATCPLWVLKTKQQLHRRMNKTSLSMLDCTRRVWLTEGLKGFYRGLTASYAGIAETVIYFTIYEKLKASYIQKHQLDPRNTTASMSSIWELPGLMVISSLSKSSATCLAYPHEVIRTRLREEPVKQQYSGFFQTVRSVITKEGLRGLYGGLPAQLIRQVPNMAILMGVYEGVVYIARQSSE